MNSLFNISRPNKILSLFTVLVLSFALSIVQGQTQNPESQRELNGFLLGQDAEAITNGFASLMKEQKYDDGWIDRVYSLDSTNTAFMVFGFPDSVHDCLSIQVTGKTETEMRPFLGLKLGDPREKVNASLGSPLKVQHFQKPHLEFLQYPNRNYSVELDSMGNLWSIRILGYEGFMNPGVDSIPSLENVLSVLRSKDPDKILELVAPDAEMFIGDSVWTFQGSARADLEDPQSPMSQLLYGEKNSLASLADSYISAATLQSRPHEINGLVSMYRLPESSSVKDILFAVHAGKWRIWEAHLSR